MAVALTTTCRNAANSLLNVTFAVMQVCAGPTSFLRFAQEILAAMLIGWQKICHERQRDGRELSANTDLLVVVYIRL